MQNAENSGARRPPADSSEEPAGGGKPSPGAEPTLEIASETLLAGRTEVRIRHRGEIYRLTLTRTGKLILHK